MKRYSLDVFPNLIVVFLVIVTVAQHADDFCRFLYFNVVKILFLRFLLTDSDGTSSIQLVIKT